MCSFDISKLNPLAHEQGHSDDAHDAYLARVGPMLPAMPGEVLLEWFQQSHGTAETWAFLDLPALTWKERSYRPTDLPGEEIMRGGPGHLQRLIKDAPIVRGLVHRRVTTDRAWKTAPVLLETANLTFLSPPPSWLRTPLHLLDGYHRFATLHSIKDELDPDSQHRFWVGS